MVKNPANTALSPDEKASYSEWLAAAYGFAVNFDGSEEGENRLFEPLNLMDAFVRKRNDGKSSGELERIFASASHPTWPHSRPTSINELMGEAAKFYNRMEMANDYASVLSQLEAGGALLLRPDASFVKTDEGQINAPGDNPQSYEVRTQPRLALLVKHLQEIGIYTDDLIIRAGNVDPDIMREHPYVIVQIPRLDKEIAVCDQVGEVTFVSNKILGPDVWEHLSKNELKARDDTITPVVFNNETQWWADIQEALGGSERQKKVKLQSFANQKPPLDMELIKQSLLAHRLEVGEWLTNSKRGQDGKKGSYILEHGPYAGQMTVRALQSALYKDGSRGLNGSTTIAALNAEISDEHELDYVNSSAQDDLDMDLIKASLLAHRQATGEWLTELKAGQDGKKGSYILEHGPYAEQITVSALKSALYRDGARGLNGSTTIAALNAEISDEHELDYVNHLDQGDLDMDLIKASLLAHRQATGEWLTNSKRGQDGKKGSYILEHGPYAGQVTINTLEHALMNDGSRGLAGSTTIAALNAEISDEHGLDYVNHLDQGDLDMDLIKASLLAHRQATGEWLRKHQAAPGGTRGSYILEHGPYAGQIAVKTLFSALYKDGSRGLAGSTTIAALNAEISDEHGLDYVNHLDQGDLDMDLIKASLLAHRQATGDWLRKHQAAPGGTRGSYILEHGPYAGQIGVGALDASLTIEGARGLAGSTTIAKLNAEISDELGLDYMNRKVHDDLDINLIKTSLLAHWQATGEWLKRRKAAPGGTPGSYILEHGPYAGQITVGALQTALHKDGSRGLNGSTTIATLNAKIKAEMALNDFPDVSP